MDNQITSKITPNGKDRQWVTLVIYVGVMILGAFIACLLFSEVLNVQPPYDLPQFALYLVLKVSFCLSLGSLIVIFGCATRDALANRTESHPAGLHLPVSILPTPGPTRRPGGLFRPPRSLD